MKIFSNLNNEIFSLYQWVLSSQQNNKLAVLTLILAIIINVLAACTNPVVYKVIFDTALQSKNITLLLWLITLVFSIYLLSVFATFAQANISASISAKTINKTRLILFNTLQNMKLNENNATEQSAILSSVTQDIVFLEYTLSHTIWKVAQYLIMGVLSAILLIYVDIYMTIVIVILIPFIIIISSHFSKIANAQFNSKKQIENDLYKMDDEGISMQSVIQYLKIKNYKRRVFKNLLRKSIKTSFTYNSNLDLASRTTALGVNLITLVILGLGVYLVIINRMTIGTLICFIVLLGNIGSSINYVSTLYPNLSQGAAYLRHIGNLLNVEFKYKSTGRKHMPPFTHSIQYRNVGVKHHEKEILSNINLTINCGNFVSFVGQSGSGKTTLLRLLIREITPSSGTILLDGTDISDISLNSLYSQISIVQQNPKLFNASIKENIRLGKLDASDEEIIAAAKLAEIHDVIMRLFLGYETIITEKNLSGGQLQRIAIARALITKPAILCLDEATVGLDLITANALDQTFDKIAKNLTVLSVTHRLTSTTNNDKIFVIDKGHIVEEGNHHELMELKGNYYQLWEKQQTVVLSHDMTQAKISMQGLKLISAFANFEDEVLERLSKEFSILKVGQNQIVFDEGDVGYKFYIIASGVVEVSILDKQTNGRIFLANLYEGDYFGEVALICNEVRNARITTKYDCVFLTLDNQQFQRIFSEMPTKLKSHILKTVAKRKRT